MSVPVNQRSQSKKTRIYDMREGIPFLGFRFKLTDTGKVLMTIDPKNVKRERLKLRRLVARSKRGALPKEKVDESFAAWRNHAGKGNTYNLLRRMDEYYTGLWKGGEADAGKKRDYEPE